MKKFIKTITATAVVGMTLASVCSAEVTLKKFDVNGGQIDISGTVASEGKQVNLIISDQSGNKGIYQSVSGTDGEFTFDIDAKEAWSGGHTATINTEDKETATVSFSGNGSYISYTEPGEVTSPKDKTEVSGVAYGNRIHINGSLDSTKITDKNVTLVIYKKDAGTEPGKDDIKYIEQTKANDNGDFTFDFSLLDDIRYYKAACFAGGVNVSGYVETAKTSSEYIIADVTVDVNGSTATLNANLENLGFEASDYMMIITAYDKNGLLIHVTQSDNKNIGAGEALTDSITLENLPSDTKTVKAMLWSVGETLIPLDSAATVGM